MEHEKRWVSWQKPELTVDYEKGKELAWEDMNQSSWAVTSLGDKRYRQVLAPRVEGKERNVLVTSSWEALSVLKGPQISYRNVWMTSQFKIAERGWNCKPWVHFGLIPDITKDSVDSLRLQRKTQIHWLILRCLSYQHHITSCQGNASLWCTRRHF